MTPRSTTLAVGYVTAASSTRVCRAGPESTLLLKTGYFESQSAAPIEVRLQLVRAPVLINVAIASLPGPGVHRWDGWAVFSDNDEVRVTTNGGTISWWISGSVLEGTFDGTQAPAADVGGLPASSSSPHPPSRTDV